MLYKESTPASPIAFIVSRIEELASIEKLNALELDIKSEFKATFEPIPHASLLPDDPVCRIQLRDPSKTIKSRSYECPRQYQDSFKTLISQRINSGFIRTSSSAHSLHHLLSLRQIQLPYHIGFVITGS